MSSVDSRERSLAKLLGDPQLFMGSLHLVEILLEKIIVQSQ